MVNEFLAALCSIAPQTGNCTYTFSDSQEKVIGFVQIIPEFENQVLIHRLWTLQPRRGNGSAILNHLCELADEHEMILKLKALPLGAKPYPFTRDQLIDWYTRHGFEGKRRKMLRTPRLRSIATARFKVLQVV